MSDSGRRNVDKLDVTALQRGLSELTALVKEQHRIASLEGSNTVSALGALLTEQGQLRTAVHGMQSELADIKAWTSTAAQLGEGLKEAKEQLEHSIRKLGAEGSKQCEQLVSLV